MLEPLLQSTNRRDGFRTSYRCLWRAERKRTKMVSAARPHFESRIQRLIFELNQVPFIGLTLNDIEMKISEDWYGPNTEHRTIQKYS